MEIKKFDVVKTLVAKENMKAGSIGTVVEIWDKNGPYEIEFIKRDTGRTIALLTMNREEFERIDDGSEEGKAN